MKERVRGLSQDLVSLGEALGPGLAAPSRGILWLGALQSGCRPDGSRARRLPGTPQGRSACRPGASGRREGLLEKQAELRASDLPGRAFPMGLGGFHVAPLSLYKLDSGGESLLVGHSCPDVAILVSCFCREVFFLSSSGFFLFVFLPPKEHL